MTIDELTERTTIDFGRRFIRSDAEHMLKMLSMKMNANVSYTVKYHNNFIAGKEDRGSFEVNGMISILGEGVGEPFRLITTPFRESWLVSGMNFILIPGYDELSNYRSETIRLWDGTRKAVAEYLQENSNI